MQNPIFNQPVEPNDMSIPAEVLRQHRLCEEKPGEWFVVSGPHPKTTARTYAHRANSGRKWSSIKHEPGSFKYASKGAFVIAQFVPKEQ